MKKLLDYICLILIYSTSVNGGYIVTSPNRLIPNRNESICVSLHNLDSNKVVNVTFTLSTYVPYYHWRPPTPGVENKTLQTVSVNLRPSKNKSNTCVKVIALSSQLEEVGHVELRVVGIQRSGSYQFNDSRYLSVLQYAPSTLTFIQTDKPVYQPGQEVKFRVLSLDSTLRPIPGNIKSVKIETPSGTIVRQWSNAVTHNGLGDFKLKLSKEPELGKWMIKVKAADTTEESSFTVDEYVLPKFEVTINPPAYVTPRMPYITVQVCAMYTYGEAVKGTAYVTTCLKRGGRWHYGGYRRNNRKDSQPCDLSSIELSNQYGCKSVNISGTKLGYDKLTQYTLDMYQIDYSGYVLEKGTDVRVNASSTSTNMQAHDIELSIEGRGIVKPGIPYSTKVKVTYKDNTVAADQNVSISLNSSTHYYIKYYTSDRNGEILLTIPHIVEDVNIYQLNAVAVEGIQVLELPTATEALSVWYSPSGHYIQFAHQEEELQCDTDVTLRLFYTSNREQAVNLTLVVVGNGDILNHTNLAATLKADTRVNSSAESLSTWQQFKNERSNNLYLFDSTSGVANDSSAEAAGVVTEFYGSLNVSLHVTVGMYPEASILVYYITEDGEIVSDELRVKVQSCTGNKVSMNFNKARGKPNEQVTVGLKASPSSLCAYGAVDKSVYLKGGDNQLTQQIFADHLNFYTLHEHTGSYLQAYRSCVSKQKTVQSSNSRGKRSSIRIPRYSPSLLDSQKSFDSAGVVVMTDLTLQTRPCYLRNDRSRQNYFIPQAMSRTLSVDSPAVFGSSAPDRSLPSVTVRDYFPETWLWNLVDVNGQGDAQVESKLPHTITEWVGNAICIHEEDGVGVSEQVNVVTYQSFFVSATLPYSVIRGETIPISLSVFNYLDACLPVQLRLKSSADYRVDGTSVVSTCVCGRDSSTNVFLISPNKLGVINITVTATIITNEVEVCNSNMSVDSSLVGVRDAIIRPLIVEPEGAPREYTISEFICMPQQGGSVTRQLELPLPHVDIVVPDSIRSNIYVMGDVMGPALSNLDNLLQMPYGCGEQNMVGFSPNVFVLQYLEGTNKDSTELRQEAIGNMLSGYQREMRYRHSDGSYSAFGPGQEDGSIWLTAFVVKCFAQASDYIYVDPVLQQKSISFFEKKQLANGCFRKVGLVHSKYMQGGMGRGRDGTTSLTAYILISMLETGVNNSSPVVIKTIDCLSTRPIADNYTLALVSYAFSLYNQTHEMTLKLYSELLDGAIKDAMTTSWKVTTDQSDADDGTWWYRPKSADVETTSYALLTVLRMTSEQNEKITSGLPIVKWLSQQRNAYGGFGSTQDTVIGLQALASFASLLNSNDLNITSVIRYQNDLSHIGTLSVDDSNTLVQQNIEMSKLAPMQVESAGTGCYLMQANVKYNVFADLLRRTAFTISIDDFASDVSNNMCKQRKLHICTRYNGVAAVTNMAVIHVRMVSGWAAERTSLKQLLKDRKVGLKRYDIEDNNGVQLYFDQITRSQLCFNMEIQRVTYVKNAKPAVVTVYDYYEKELSSDAEYDILSSFCAETARRTNTKEDLPTINLEEYENSLTQARMPSPVIPPWLDIALESENVTDKCPVCYGAGDTFNVTSSICDFKKVYKMLWRAKTNYRLSLTSDLRQGRNKRIRKVLINYSLPQNCSCIALSAAEKGGKLLMMGDWETDMSKGDVLGIAAQSVVVPWTRDLEVQIKKLIKRC